jgi:hypothetical protein
MAVAVFSAAAIGELTCRGVFEGEVTCIMGDGLVIMDVRLGMSLPFGCRVGFVSIFVGGLESFESEPTKKKYMYTNHGQFFKRLKIHV